MVLDNFRTIELIWDKANKSIIKTVKTASSDTTGRYLSVKVLDGGQEVTLSGASLQLYWEHPNFNTRGTDNFNTVNNGGLFQMTFSKEMLTNVGELDAYLVLALPDGKITSDVFKIKVIKGASTGVVIPSDGESAAIQALYEAMEKLNNFDGGPSIFMDNLSELQTTYPNGAPGVALVKGTNPAKIYIWNGTAWEDFGDYQGIEVKDGSITPSKTSFLIGYPNLLDKTKGKANTNINPSSGDEVDIEGYYLSDYIPIKRNVQINLSKIRMLARFTVDKEIIPNDTVGEADFQIRQEYSFIPTHDGYIRATFRETEEFPEWTNGVVNEGGELLSIDDVGLYLDDSVLIKQESLPQREASLSRERLAVLKNGDKIQIKYRYNDLENEIVEFNRLGINNIIHPKAFYRESSSTLTAYFDNLNTRYTINTDWVSPYATLVADGGTTSFGGTVGGNHGTVGSGGHATARPVSEEYFLDGETIKDGSFLYGDEVKIVVNNYVSARNRINPDTGAKADSLLETVVYTITPNSIEVSVYCTANEPLNMGNYTGLQMTCALVPGGEIYFSEDTVGKFIDDGLRHDSSALPYNGDRVVISNENDLVAVYTNREVGLGDLSHKGSTPIHFVNGNKMYSHLINPDNQVHLDTGESAYYSGGYSIMKPLECIGAEKAYFIKVNGTKIYCVDFLENSVNAYLKLPSNELGKTIEVLEKTETVSVDEIISGKGLKINSSGIGTLKFIIKS